MLLPDTDAASAEWDAFVASQPGSSFFQFSGFTVGGGPLAYGSDALAALLAEAEELGRARNVAYVELRDCGHAGPGWQSKSDLYAGFEGPIAAKEDDNLKQIPRKQRAVVRKALE